MSALRHDDTEGVIKFACDHSEQPWRSQIGRDHVVTLRAWREVLQNQHVIGVDPLRYDGIGFGNMSARVPPYSSARGHRPFIITGTQTNGLQTLSHQHFALVHKYDLLANRLESVGAILPSSEAMTHGAIYDLSPTIRYVFHGHCPILFHQRRSLRIPTTRPHIPYGTVQMAQEMKRLCQESTLFERRIVAMDAHQDGIITFGKTASEAGETFLSYMVQATIASLRTERS